MGKKIAGSSGNARGGTRKANANANKSFASTNYTTQQGGQASRAKGQTMDDYGLGYQQQGNY